MKKAYKKPQISKVELDYTISLLMESAPTNPGPRGGTNNGNKEAQPFQSPFGDKPFN